MLFISNFVRWNQWKFDVDFRGKFKEDGKFSEFQKYVIYNTIFVEIVSSTFDDHNSDIHVRKETMISVSSSEELVYHMGIIIIIL